MDLATAVASLTKSDLRAYLTNAAMVLAMVARFTKTQKDDAAAVLLMSIANNNDQMDTLNDMLGLTE